MAAYDWMDSGQWGLSSGAVGLLGTGLALTGVGAIPLAGIAAVSGIMSLFGKQKGADEQEESIKKQQEQVRNESNMALSRTRMQSMRGNKSALDAFRSGDYDTARKIKARIESGVTDRREAIVSGSQKSLSKLHSAFSKIKGVNFTDVATVVGSTALAGFGGYVNELKKATKLVEAGKSIPTLGPITTPNNLRSVGNVNKATNWWNRGTSIANKALAKNSYDPLKTIEYLGKKGKTVKLLANTSKVANTGFGFYNTYDQYEDYQDNQYNMWND